jgi:glycerol-3-phosphate dehydrogenase (NAD+)
MAYTAAKNGHAVVMFMRDAKQCECINTQAYNPKYLSNYKLDTLPGMIRGICTEQDLKTELQKPGVVVILALPCQKTPGWIKQHRDMIHKDTLLCSTAKGLYLPTKQLIGHAILDSLDRAEQPLAFLSGPSFAEEIVKGYPTAVVVASDQLFLAVKMQKILSNKSSFRVYTSQDPIGVQLGGALKNPLAVGAGMIAGMGFGTNTLAACVTRASRELCDLCIAMGGNPKTIDGLSGIGDLMLTCFSSQSRNQRCGQRLIKGEAVADIEKDYTVEGVPTASVAVAYADMCGLELPLFRVVNDLIHKNISPDEAVPYLMGRPLLQETSRAHMAYTSLS